MLRYELVANYIHSVKYFMFVVEFWFFCALKVIESTFGAQTNITITSLVMEEIDISVNYKNFKLLVRWSISW